MGVWKRFKADQNGATAVMFGLSLLPVMGLMGAAVDYSRASMVNAEVQRAADVAALALVREASSSGRTALTARAQAIFNDAYHAPNYVAVSGVTASYQDKTVTVKASVAVTNAFMQIAGIRDTTFSATSSSSMQKIELALVLDNTGSMADTISGERKIDALKTQAKKLLSSLQGAALERDSVKVSVVPFDTEVRLDAGTYRYNKWFWWKDEANDPKSWTGYVYDRWDSYATTDDAPAIAIEKSRFPAPVDTEYHTNAMLKKLSTGDLATLKPLTSLYGSSDYKSLVSVVDGMKPRGYTNIALGMMWGLATLSPGEPFTEGAAYSDATVKKFVVLLTDGNNTMNHVNGELKSDESKIDTTTQTACGLVKKNGVTVFTIRLLEGNASLLKSCSSGDGYYFNVQSKTDLTNAFNNITTKILGTRLTH